MVFLECKRLQKLLNDGSTCEMKIVEKIAGLDAVFKDIFTVFIGFIAVMAPVGYLLAMMSLRPVRESIETIDGFINGIVHDINTPLSVIKLNAQSMGAQLSSERLVNQNRRVLEGIGDIEALEEQLLFSLKADRYELNKTHFDLETLLQNRLEYWNDLRASVRVSCVSHPLHVEADASLLMRMIDNIVGNAIKFSPRQSEVSVRLEGTKLMIQDHGCGIKAPKKVFTKYYREGATSKGLGLGLFIVHSIAQLHGIEVEILSKLGEGSTFVVQLEKVSE